MKPDFVHTGPATVAGRYLRRFWHPVCESSRLARGHAIPLTILGESFTLYRGESGAAHLTVARCPHRLTQLSLGRVEGEAIRCFFHGWKFEGGRCVDQPAEPRPFCAKVHIENHPVIERFGLIFGYFGKLPAPPLADWPELNSENAVSSMAILPCNYFQSAENILDDAHVGFSHGSARELGGSARGAVPRAVGAIETDFGLTVSFQHENHVSKNHFVMPNACYMSYELRFAGASGRELRAPMRTLFWYVPVDDHSHQHVMVTDGPELIMERIRAEREQPIDVSATIAAVLAGRSRVHLDGTRLPDLLRIQDGVAIAGQGVIADRQNERLGASDAGVILLRKIWMRELRALAGGKRLRSFARPDAFEDSI
jgi:5,5'-dehydrodivanillate O-demethylase